jgi:molybdopterin synthase sulfur carrier subunit
MTHVVLTGALRQFTGGQSEFDLEAANVRQLLRQLGQQHPALQPHLEDGIAIVIDGEIYQDALLEPIPPESEVHLIPKIGGG